MTAVADVSPGAAREIAGLRIGEVARRTGTTTALLRAWESRHGVLTPTRTAGGQRLYSEQDVARVRLVQQMVSEGWTIAGAVSSLRERGALPPESRGSLVDDQDDDEGPARGRRLVAGSDLLAPLAEVDPEAVRAAFDTARAMLRAGSPGEVRDALVALVRHCGASTGPAATQDDDVIPVDLSFGAGPPLLPRAAPASVARMRLEALLPPLVEDGRTLINHLRLAATPVSRPERARR